MIEPIVFKFETDCSPSKGWYCQTTITFFGKTAKDAELKAKAYVRELTVREEMEDDE